MGSKSRRNRKRADKKPVPCILCGNPADCIGFWTPTRKYARYLGSQAIVYAICLPCRKKPGSIDKVEKAIIGDKVQRDMDTGVAPDPPETYDEAALDRICRPRYLTKYNDVIYMYIEPLEEPGDYRDFDREVCKAGLTQFVRPRTASDLVINDTTIFMDLDETIGNFARYPHVLVIEQSPGLRLRQPVECFPPESMN